MLLEKGRLNVGFCDGQWGSSGKGKFNALLANMENPNFAVSHNSVNASHIVCWDDGREYKFQHLPSSVVNPSTKVVMGAGASIELPQMLKEMRDWGLDTLTPQRLFIHPNAVVITPDDVDYEKQHLVRIASTMTGNGAAAGRKVMRHPSVKTTSDCPELTPYIADTSTLIAEWLKEGQTGILETAQGFDLSMDHGMVFKHSLSNKTHKAYPYCTSRNVDPLTFAGMTGVGQRMLGNVLLNLRANPIKVGDGSNTKLDGYSGVDMSGSNSGPCWPDQVELDFEKDLGVVAEMTSLTKRKRRIFSFSDMQLKHITKIVQPHFMTINFVNYTDPEITGRNGEYSRDVLKIRFPKVASLVERVENGQYWSIDSGLGGRVVWLGTGPKESEYITLVG